MKTIDAVFCFFGSMNLEEALILIFLFFYISEWLMGKLVGLKIHHPGDSIQNFLIGSISFLFDFLFSLLTLPLLNWLFLHCAIFHFGNTAWPALIALFILVDFSEYWFHRFSHEVNILWSAHVVHHQSGFFNLSVGLRTSLFVPFFNIFIYALFPLLGFEPGLVLLIIFIQGIYQLIIHTELVRKLGILEKIFVTPSAHRVHHGKNEIYIDRNYGKFFIVWDILFGTYQEETEQVSYGVLEEKRKGVIASVFGPYSGLLSFFLKEKNGKKRRKALFGSPGEAKEVMTEKNGFRS